MLTEAVAVALVLSCRIACLGGRTAPRLWGRLLSGLCLGVASWAMGALLRAWVPLWEMLTLGVALELTVGVLPVSLRIPAQALADLTLVLALAVLSIVPTPTADVALAAAAFAALGFALDSMAGRLAPQGRLRLIGVAGVIILAFGLSIRQVSSLGWQTLARDPALLLRLTLVAPQAGSLVALKSGAGAWMLRTAAGHPRGTALLLHGNDPLASRQPAATALRGALTLAGYDVLSIDHPAFGASPAPDPSDWAAWDPTIGPKLAVSYLSTVGARGPQVIVAAHSMGVDVALKLIQDESVVSQVFLFGGSLDRATEPESVWINGFHRNRRLPCCVPLDTLRGIREHFYRGADRFAENLPAQHPVVNFVRFGIEYEDVARDRELLYAAIPAPKTSCKLEGISHYFNSLSLGELVLIDTRSVIRTAELLAGSEPTCTATALASSR